MQKDPPNTRRGCYGDPRESACVRTGRIIYKLYFLRAECLQLKLKVLGTVRGSTQQSRWVWRPRSSFVPFRLCQWDPTLTAPPLKKIEKHLQSNKKLDILKNQSAPENNTPFADKANHLPSAALSVIQHFEAVAADHAILLGGVIYDSGDLMYELYCTTMAPFTVYGGYDNNAACTKKLCHICGLKLNVHHWYMMVASRSRLVVLQCFSFLSVQFTHLL